MLFAPKSVVSKAPLWTGVPGTAKSNKEIEDATD